MVPAKGTPSFKSDFHTWHLVFRIRWLHTWSFGICAYLYNYCEPIVIIEPNKRRLTNTGSLISLVIGYVGRFWLVSSHSLDRTGPIGTLAPRLEDGQSEEFWSEVIVMVGLPEVRRDVGDTECVTWRVMMTRFFGVIRCESLDRGRSNSWDESDAWSSSLLEDYK